MASGNTLCVVDDVRSASFPAATFPTFDIRNNHPVLDFATGEIAYFEFVMPRHYAGGGVTIYLHYAMTSATANNVKFETDFERIGDGLQDLDADGFTGSPQNTGDVTVPATSGHVDITTTTHTNGAQMDSAAVGEKFRLSVKRVAPSGTDATGDAELVGIEIKEQ